MADGPALVVRCHVVAVTHDLSSVLTFPTAAGWFLPYVESNVLPGVLDSVQTMLQGWTHTSTIVHTAPLTLGPSLPREAYCVALVETPRPAAAVKAIPLSVLRNTHPLLPIQREAVVTSLARLREPRAPFDSIRHVSAALAWAEQQIGELTGARVLSTSRFRCGRHEYVVGLETTAGPMYFKGGPERVADEATLTDFLSHLRPRHFPQTLAIDRANERWLYRALEGESLNGCELTVALIAEAARALASLQKAVLGDAETRAHLRERCLSAVAMCHRADLQIRRARQGLTMEAPEVVSAYSKWDRGMDRILETCKRLDDLQLPMTLVLSDFWTTNILRTPEGIGFIDVGSSYWGLPALPLWRFINDVEQRFAGNGARAAIEHAFATEWADLIAPSDMHACFSRLPLLWGLFTILLVSEEWDLDERALDAAACTDYRAMRLLPLLRYIRRTLRAMPS